MKEIAWIRADVDGIGNKMTQESSLNTKIWFLTNINKIF